MRVEIVGARGPLAEAVRAEMERRGHVVAAGAECAICFPCPEDELERAVRTGGFRRLVLRSHASAYGFSPKNPGRLAEDRVSLAPLGSPEQRWLRAEAIAARHPHAAAVRLASVLARGEGDLAVRLLTRRAALSPAARDPNLQFIALADAARALAAAAESDASGIFNAAGGGALPWSEACRAARVARIPVPAAVGRLFGARLDPLCYDWTVSGERATRELGFTPRLSSVQGLAEFLAGRPSSRPQLLRQAYDEWGLDERYIRSLRPLLEFLRKRLWRVECEGLDNVPAEGPALLVSNHRGLMPLDAVMLVWTILNARRRVPRYLIVPALLKTPFMFNFLTKMGGVTASRENAARLLGSGSLVGIFPEGVRGAFGPYRETYRLRDFSRSAYARMAIGHGVPVIPAAIVGHAEIYPILGHIEWKWLKRNFGWPSFPIAPPFPLPFPLPSKWHIRVLPPVLPDGLSPGDADNPALVNEFSRHIQQLVQSHIDEMLRRRRHIFWGRIFPSV